MYDNLLADILRVLALEQLCVPNEFYSEHANNSVPFSLSHGTRQLGMSGDPSPPSRLVYVFYLRGLAQSFEPPDNFKYALALSSSLLYSVSIPYESVMPLARKNFLLDYSLGHMVDNVLA